MDFKKNKIAKFSLTLLCILLISMSAFAAGTAFSIDQPDGTDDSTSAYYTVEWTPFLDPIGNALSMLPDANTITCYADPASSGYNTGITLFTGIPCCDTNTYRINVSALGTRSDGGEYYVWCTNDANSDMNAYSGGVLTLVRFKAGDLAGMSIDIIAGITVGIADNAFAIGTIIAIIIILMFLLDIFTGIFGLFNKFRELAGRRG